MIEALRRNMMSAIIEEESPYKDDYGELYPKSSFSERGDVLNLLTELEEYFSRFDYGVKFADSDEDVIVTNIGGPFKKTAGYAYVINGEIIRNESVNNVSNIVLPAEATNRMVFVIFNFYGCGANTNKESLAIKKISYGNVHYVRNMYNWDAKQVYIKKTVSDVFHDNAQNQGSSDAVEIDTCTLKLFNDLNSRIVKFNNYPNLESVIIRRAAGNVLYTGSYATFKGCTNINKVTLEWDSDEEIPTYDVKMQLPLTATLYIPKGTLDMYTNKGWNFAEIIEY